MLIGAARRAEAAAKEMLAHVNTGSASCAEMREMLALSRATVAIISAAQTSAAAAIAGRERHGDGGTQVLADAAGLSRSDARSQVKTAQVIDAAPTVRDAVESGRVPAANAKRLADAIEKTGADVVESDPGLLAKAQAMRPEQFTRESRRWTADRQADGGAADYQRLRTKRCVRVWDSDDGTVEMHAKFDPVTGRRIANRLQADARRLLDADKKNAGDRDARRRSFDQCMADALDALASGTAAGSGKPFADICVVAHVDDGTGELIAELPDGVRLPPPVLEQLSCNAKLTGVVYDRKGKPIWRTESRRTVTEAQWQLLIARWGGCFHCGANPGICQAHHIEPACRGGPTKLDNLVPACWSCHHRIHHDGWQIHKSSDGHHTLHPPDRVRHGPSRAPDHPPPLCDSGGRRKAEPSLALSDAALNEPGTSQHATGTAPAPPGADQPATGSVRSGPAAARAALQRARTACGADPSLPF
jgi:hypothetical protein